MPCSSPPGQAQTEAPRHRRRLLYAVLFLAFVGAMVWLVWASRGALSWGAEPIFRGKPESYWVTNVSYWPSDSEIKQWQAFGPDGVRVLIRGLEHANRPWERAYRKTYPRIAPRLPQALARFLPAPKMDSTRATRMCLISLLSSLGTNASIAEPIMARTLRDEAASVRQLAIGFFTHGEDEKAPLNQLDAKEKRKLLPHFIRDMEDQRSGNWGLRNNAALALRYYPEERQVVAPVLVTALSDPVPTVRLVAAGALNHVDPEASRKARAVSVVIPILRDPDDQVAYRAAELLGHMKNEAELAVPALIQALENTNTLVACTAVWAFQSGKQFDQYRQVIVPALNKAAQRKDNVAGYAKAALKHFESLTAKTAK